MYVPLLRGSSLQKWSTCSVNRLLDDRLPNPVAHTCEDRLFAMLSACGLLECEETRRRYGLRWRRKLGLIGTTASRLGPADLDRWLPYTANH